MKNINLFLVYKLFFKIKKVTSIGVFLISLLTFVSCRTSKTIPKSIVEINGALSVKDNLIVNSKGKPVSFAGNSFFWSNSNWKGANFYNKDIVNWLKDDWNSSIVRCAITADSKIGGGYLDNPIFNEAKIDIVVQAAIDLGLYVIIDWHSHNAHKYEKEAINFFKKMATKYGKYPNVIYEIYNEPLNVSWDTIIKPYAENVIAEIRKIDAENLIVVGTPNWSQDIDVASKNPINNYKNIAYTLHFYARSHKEELRDKAKKAIDNGIAIMVTEWGTVKANGDGDVDAESVEKWMNFMKKHHITHCNWAVNNKKEGASIIYPGVNYKGNWKDADLTPSGKLAKSYIKNWDN